MKKITVAFLYNVRHSYPDPKVLKTQLEADFDDPETIRFIIKHLKECGFNVIPIEANEDAYEKLKKNKKRIDVVLNYSEGIHGADREAQLPAMLEMLQIPYTGSPPLSQALMLNKAKTKEVLIANGIPTAPFQLISYPDEPIRKSLHYPLIVKPVSEGSGAGITNKSVVHTERELREQIRWIHKIFRREDVLIEPFLSGPEYSVGMIGNPPTVLPFISPNHTLLPKGLNPIDSLEVKWVFEEEVDNNQYLMCPPIMKQSLKKKIEKICFATWDALHIRDMCRIDLRCDSKLRPYVLEVNSPPGLLPPEVSTTSYFPLAVRTSGIEYNEMLKLIIKSALKRHSK